MTLSKCSVSSCDTQAASQKSPYCRKHKYHADKGRDPETYVPHSVSIGTRLSERTCEVAFCDQKHRSNGYCARHLQQLRRGHDPNEYDLDPPPKHSKGGNWREPDTSHGSVRRYQSGCRCVECMDKVFSKRRKKALLLNYGMSLEEYDTLYKNQEGRCDICGNMPSEYMLVVDHNHETGEVRGLLCRPCNSGIGLLRDSEMIVAKALEYLKKNG